jgi:LPS O-antigen subunit length determinant protein (WzzB/FepE family)
MPMYYSKTTYEACNVVEKPEPGEVIAKALNPNLAKTSPIITISYKEESPENAQKCLEGVLDDIRTSQNLLAKPIIQSKNIQLVNLRQKLENAENFIKKLPNKNLSFDFSDSKFSASTLLLVTTMSKENEIKDLRTQINDLEIAMLEPQTKETFLSAPIYAPLQIVSPKRAMVLMGGVIAGLFVGLFLMIGKRAYGVYKSSIQQ